MRPVSGDRDGRTSQDRTGHATYIGVIADGDPMAHGKCNIRAVTRGCGLESGHDAGRPDQVDLGAGITPAPAYVFRCASKNATILRRAFCAGGSWEPAGGGPAREAAAGAGAPPGG